MESAGTGAVVEPLLTLEREDLTGLLDFVAQGVTTRIFVRGGEIVFADLGTVGETLGRMLIRCGRLGEEHVAAILRHMTDALVDGRHVSFGEVLVEHGFVNQDELEIVLTQQVKEKLIGCVHRGTGAWTFSKNDRRVDEVGSYGLRTRPMLVEAAAQLSERRIETVLVLNQNRFPEIVAPEPILIEEFELSRTEAAVLRDLDGTSSVQFLLSSKPALANAAPLIASLVLGHGVELRTTPAGVRQSSENRRVPPEFRTARRARFDDDGTVPHAAPPVAVNGATKRLRPSAPDLPVLGRPSSIGDSRHSSPTITVAQNLTQRRSSRKGIGPPSPDVRARTQRAFDKLKVALDAHKPISKKRRWPDPTSDRERRLMAEAAFHSGRMHLRADEAERALPGLHRAHELSPEEHEYELYVKWAQMLVNDTFSEDARRTELQTLAARIAREDGTCALALVILGHCTMHEGKREAAVRFFRRAAELDSKVVDSERLAQLLRAQEGEGTKRHTPSRIDLSTRKGVRGHLPTPLDELVPSSVTAIAQSARGSQQNIRGSEPRTRTPHGGLQALGAPSAAANLELTPTPQGPPITETPHPPAPPLVLAPTPVAPVASPRTPSAGAVAPPAPPPLVSPPPPVAMRPPLPAPASVTSPTLPSRSTPPKRANDRAEEEARSGGHLGPESQTQVMALAPPPPMPSAPPPPSARVGPMPAHARSASAFPAAATTERASQHIVLDKVPSGKPKHSRAVTLALAWSASIAVTAGMFYFVGTRDTWTSAAPSSITSATAAQGSSSPTASAAAVAVDRAETTAAAPPAPPPAASVSAGPAPPAEAANPLPQLSAKTPPAASTTEGGRPMTTGSLRTPKAFGRRIYVDGRIVGEGGRDLTVPCGSRRVKVGSAGTERRVTIPCGGLIELD